ncbi:hypothetical protein F3Y22_tig00112217pilonHSYRG00013 [Hibiscus syriacus]|uniref:RNase H type-1 domain-containing protein n=1 Tax=Hibiscus syriacus TaxID=106335 RepID=A0A6A2YCY1_HIBSY|nr:hypothetical protein F3Y22_tig00112217pilonHSYRG00013 [Hibiscus syriacus]
MNLGTFKLKVDGAFPRPPALPAIGKILGNSDGVVITGQAFLVGVPRSASVVEALAITYDVQLAMSIELSRVVIESDCWNVVQQFNIRDVRQLLAAHSHISARFIHREVNGAAPALANYA